MNMQEFFDYKNQLMKDMLTTKAITDLIDDTVVDVDTMAYDNIMPCEFYPETLEEGKVYICFDVDVYKTPNSTFYDLYLYIWIFIHKSLMRLPQGGLRSDALCNEIDKKVNGSYQYGMGKLNLVSAKRFAPVSDFCGKIITYAASDFNSPNDERDKYIPVNRKQREI